MSKILNKFGAGIPELKDKIRKYGCKLTDNPQFVLIGKYTSEEIGPVMGILAATNNEFHAHLLKREFSKKGDCSIEHTEFHPGKQTFSIAIYKQKMQERMAASGAEE